MTTGLVAASVGTDRLPESVRALVPATGVDYADLFTLATDVQASPRRWALAMFGAAPSPAERFIWRGLLQLRLCPGRSPDTVGGWRVTGRGPDWLRLEVGSWHLSATFVVRTAPGRVSLATLLRYERATGRVVWTALSGVHRALIPGVLRGAAARVAATG